MLIPDLEDTAIYTVYYAYMSETTTFFREFRRRPGKIIMKGCDSIIIHVFTKRNCLSE